MDGFRHYARKGSFRAYLRTAVVHALGRTADRNARQEAVLDPHVLEALANAQEGDDVAWEREEYLHRVRWAMRQIAGEFEAVTLEAFRLHVLADRSVAETAEHLGLSKDSVYQAKSRILKRLRERVKTLGSGIFDFGRTSDGRAPGEEQRGV
jgi:RNA polymerase sigma-70 factor (ECF subfamily)